MQDIKSQPRMRILTFLPQCVKELSDQFGRNLDQNLVIFLPSSNRVNKTTQQKEVMKVSPPLLIFVLLKPRLLSPTQTKQTGFKLRYTTAIFFFTETDDTIFGNGFNRETKALQFFNQDFKGSRNPGFFDRLAFHN